MSLKGIFRLKEEFDDLNANPITNIGLSKIILPKKDSYFEWEFSIIGAKDTCYRGGTFFLRAIFPDNYPESAPEICFITPIYHLNVNPKRSQYENLGHICLSTLNWWKPEYTMREVITNLFALFYMQNPECPYGLDRADEFRNNRKLFENKAKYFTEKYARLDSGWDFSYNK